MKVIGKFKFILITVFIISCNSDDEGFSTQIESPKLEFKFDGQNYYGVTEYQDDHYLGWIWYWIDGNFHQIGANISTIPNSNQETNMDIFLDFTNSGDVVPGQTFNNSDVEIQLWIGYDEWYCNPCEEAEIKVTNVSSDGSISGTFSGKVNGDQNGAVEKYITNGVFYNIPN